MTLEMTADELLLDTAPDSDAGETDLFPKDDK